MWMLVNRPVIEKWVDEWSFILEPPEWLGYDETVDHLCWNTLCCNPDHLRILTRSGNTAERWRR